MLVRPLMTNLKTTEMTVLFLHVAPSSVYKSSCPTGCQWAGSGGSQPLDRCLTLLSQLLASEIKQSFLSTYLACLLAFEQQAAGSHIYFGN